MQEQWVLNVSKKGEWDILRDIYSQDVAVFQAVRRDLLNTMGLFSIWLHHIVINITEWCKDVARTIMHSEKKSGPVCPSLCGWE